MKIIFDFILDETPLHLQIAKSLADNMQCQIVGVTLGNRWHREISSACIPNLKLYNLADYMQKELPLINIKSKLETLKNSYNHINFSFCLKSDRFIRQHSYDSAVKMLIAHFEFWEKLLQNEKPKAIVSVEACFLLHISAIIVGQKHGVLYVGLGTDRISAGKFSICSNYINSYDTVKKCFQNLLKQGMNETDYATAKTYLSCFRENQKKPSYMQHSWHSSMTMNHVKEFMRRFKSYYIEGHHPYDYFSLSPFYYLKRDLMRLYNSKLSSYHKPFDSIDSQDKYLLFPLHYQPEASTLVLGQHYDNQLATVENISSCLPPEYKLYVKEHKTGFGLRDKYYYQAIKNNYNVKLISPHENAHKLIQNSEAVITISGTMGWEAIMLKKVVFVLGSVFYLDSELCFKINSYSEMQSLFSRILGNPSYSVDENKLLLFIAALLQCTYKGIYYIPHADQRVMNKDNINNLSYGVLDYIKDPFSKYNSGNIRTEQTFSF